MGCLSFKFISPKIPSPKLMNPLSKYSLPKPLVFSPPKSSFLNIKTLVLKQSQCRFSSALNLNLNLIQRLQVGHVVACHPSEEFIRVMWVVIVKVIFILQLANVGFYEVGFYGCINFNTGVNELTWLFLELPWSRSAEMEADYIGLLVMASAGYDPRVAPMVHRILDKSKTDLFSTHPTGKKRADALLRGKVMEEARARFCEAISHKMNRIQKN